MKSAISANAQLHLDGQMYSSHPRTDYEVSTAKMSAAGRLLPSRWNVSVVTRDGKLAMWNTLSGAVTMFAAQQAGSIEDLVNISRKHPQGERVLRYLRTKGFLVDEAHCEMQRLRAALECTHFRNDMLHLTLLPTEQCNFRCRYCYEEFKRGTMTQEVRERVKVLIRNRIASLNSLSVSWFGGEPLCGWAVIEDLAPFFLRMSESHDIAYQSGMTTNGFLLTPNRVSKLLAWGCRQFQVTVDGMKEEHDRTRPTRHGKGTFSTIVKNLSRMALRSDNFSLILRVNYQPWNLASIERLLDFFRPTWEGDPRFRIHFHSVGRLGGERDESLLVFNGREAEVKRGELSEMARARGLKCYQRGGWHAGQGVCYAGSPNSFVVGSTGRIMKCTVALEKDERNIVGVLDNSGGLNLDERKSALWTQPALERARCKKCPMLPQCLGIACPLKKLNEGYLCDRVLWDGRNRLIDRASCEK